MSASVLIIDDEPTFSKNVARYLDKCGHTTLTADDGKTGLSLFESHSPDFVILDYRLPDMDGIAIIHKIRALDTEVPILMLTGHGSIELAVEAMKAGANDLLTKPAPLSDLQSRIDQFTAQRKQSGRLKYLESKQRADSGSMIGNSPALREIRERIARIAAVEGEHLPPVLILGETGTGKELVARALHAESSRAAQPFVEINCASIPDNLLESELFGHERGAFTDAKEKKIGLFEAADGGTLFLDEIGEMNLALQAKLLKAIEDGRFRRVGGTQERQVSLRIVAATNQDLEERIRNGAFRSDLYFRLRVLQIMTLPLRQRREDILTLAHHFLEFFAKRYARARLQLSSTAEAALQQHGWPGNVRELRNVMEQAVLLARTDTIDAADLMIPGASLAALPSAESASLLDANEREMIVAALSRNQGNVTQTARELGISRDTLRYRIEKHGLK